MWEQRHADVEYMGAQYSASTNPDGSVTYQKASHRGIWYTVRPDARDPWLRSIPISAKRQLLRKLGMPSDPYYAVGSRENPLGDNLALVGVGIVALLAVGFALWSSTAAASTPNTWPASQFSNGSGGGTAILGEYVLLVDGSTGKNIVVQVTGISADQQSATGTVYYAPIGASQSAGDICNFNVANIISSNSSSAILQGLL
jgi:hypothetical protein